MGREGRGRAVLTAWAPRDRLGSHETCVRHRGTNNKYENRLREMCTEQPCGPRRRKCSSDENGS